VLELGVELALAPAGVAGIDAPARGGILERLERGVRSRNSASITIAPG
jgi:hypothetical protein